MDEPAEAEHAAQLAASSTVDVPVKLRGTAAATLKATVYVNPKAGGTSTILSVPGFTATGKFYGPLTTALFADTVTGQTVKQVVTLDLPGHGDSTRAAGIKYGDLTIDDYADALVQSIQVLSGKGLGPVLVVGAGAGGLTIAAAQEQLLKAGSSLSKLGVRSALLYAPVPSAGRPWTMQPVNPQINSYIQTTPADGAVYTVPLDIWNRQGFTNKAGTKLASSPTADQVTAGGFAASEPVAVVSQLTGINDPAKGAPTPRPTVRAGAFSAENGTNLIVLGFSEAIQVPTADVADFYVHLTGDAAKARFAEVVGPEAVSNAYFTIPKAVIEATYKFFVPAS